MKLYLNGRFSFGFLALNLKGTVVGMYHSVARYDFFFLLIIESNFITEGL